MASGLAEAQIVAKQRLQHVIAAAVATAWTDLGRYDRQQVDQWLSTVLPLTAAANRQAVALTQAFIARAASQMPSAVDAQQIIGGIRNGTPPAEVYSRPFVTVWGALKRGVPWAEAVRMGQDRATAAAATDVQLSFTHTLRAVGTVGDRIVGWERVPDSTACDFCRAASGLVYSTGDLLPLHTWCGCGTEPVYGAKRAGPIDPPPDQFSGPGDLQVAVRQHGELGPVLTNAADHFTSQAEIAQH